MLAADPCGVEWEIDQTKISLRSAPAGPLLLSLYLILRTAL